MDETIRRARLQLCLFTALVAVASLVPATRTEAEPLVAGPSVADSLKKYKFLGKTARDKGDHADVVKYYASLLTFDNDYHLGYYYTARSQLALGDHEAGKKALLAAVALKPNHANTNLLLFQVYAGQNKPDTAWAHLGPLMAASPAAAPKYQAYRRTIADLYRRAGKIAIAVTHYQAIVSDATMPEAKRQELYELLAVLHDDLGDAAQAILWRQKVTGDVQGRVESLSKMVDLQIETKDYMGACATLETLTLIDSAGRYSHFVRMSDLGEMSADHAMKLAGLEGMARCQPKDVATVATIVQIHLISGDLERADTWLDRGLRQTPTDAQLRVMRGDLLLLQEAIEDSVIAEYEFALQDPNWAAVAQQRIWQIRPPETKEEKSRKDFFGLGDSSDQDDVSDQDGN